MDNNFDELYGNLRLPKIFTATSLKIIAMLIMVIDHVAAILLHDLVFANYSIGYRDNFMIDMVLVMRTIGRLSFPIFAFLIVESYTYTRSRPRFILRLGIFAIITEPMFNYAQNSTWLYPQYQSNMVTWTLAIIAIYLYDLILQRFENTSINKILSYLTAILPVISIAVFNHFIGSDYGYEGILVCFGIYILRNNRVVAMMLASMILIASNGSIQFMSLLAIIPILMYNDTRGKGLKYFFYLFYPLHLLIIRVITNRIIPIVINVSG